MKKVNLFIPVLWLGAVIYLTVVYGNIPSQIGTHYGAHGMPDQYGAKSSLWSLPLIFMLIWTIITIMVRYLPKIERNLKGKNERNTATLGTEMITTLFMIEVGVWLLFVTNVYYLSHGKSYLPPYLLTAVLIVLLVYIIGLFLKRLIRTRNLKRD
ncbi:DUF1648 domain-containing protein [Staphylococcus sp. IVB6227]|uniref:DUF1648 domain-containing protein n=1 Tax=Staphylococcus sp. IVB6227 TaxID=2989768 RepID=UPI0021D04D82|nr:DUF1648 domain-containing protein [Staphylococcus sp. IVB6227]UXR78196.1 DUF1648 domain-containing protein [Staphylococcus sp. IVB6227]